ncbi:MAG: bifunctional riboflavin kinase/FAD synthetase [Alphaproteobacteria bacterium]|nr:bifunctional riboflavin kinase/FAD synthetase [Alphaproteobacteria bacterium]
MRLFRHIPSVPADASGAVVAIGNFDGLHRGHQVVLAAARAQADADGRALALMTFRPHPRRFFRPDEEPFRLTPFRGKVRAIAGLGVDTLLVCRFDGKMASITAEDFIETLLHNGLGAAHVVVGHDFAFGNKRRGNPAMLQAKGGELGFGVTIVEPAKDASQEIYSSSVIRQALQDGQPERAAALLGRLWEIEGRVLTGDQRGRTIGFPTANIDPAEYVQPARGVYSVRAGVTAGDETQWFDGVANLGVRPTVDGHRLLLETHLFDFAGDLYGKYLRVALVDHLRAERKFENFEALKHQITVDCEQARENLATYAAKSGDSVGF